MFIIEFLSFSVISGKYSEDERSLIISNDGNKKGPEYRSMFHLISINETSFYIGAHHDVQLPQSLFNWKNSVFVVTSEGKIYRLTHESKLESNKNLSKNFKEVL